MGLQPLVAVQQSKRRWGERGEHREEGGVALQLVDLKQGETLLFVIKHLTRFAAGAGLARRRRPTSLGGELDLRLCR